MQIFLTNFDLKEAFIKNVKGRKEMSLATGIKNSKILKIAKGNTMPTVEEKHKICNFFQQDMDFVFGEDGVLSYKTTWNNNVLLEKIYNEEKPGFPIYRRVNL